MNDLVSTFGRLLFRWHKHGWMGLDASYDTFAAKRKLWAISTPMGLTFGEER